MSAETTAVAANQATNTIKLCGQYILVPVQLDFDVNDFNDELHAARERIDQLGSIRIGCLD